MSFETNQVGRGKIVVGDCLSVMREMDDDQVILALTSPPYFNAINYDDHTRKLAGHTERWERVEVSYDEYRSFLTDRFKELLRVTKPGGHNVVNIAPVGWKGERTPLPFHFVGWMEEIGWRFKEDIIWEKPVAKDRRSGVLLQHPYPGYYYPSLVAEYIFVFQKPSGTKGRDNIYWNRTEDEKEANRLNLADYQGEKSKNVWNIRPMSPQENIHPCPYPLDLARRVIEFYSYKNDLVIDIFAGSGQTNLAAERLERRHIGIEIVREYADYAVEQLKASANQATVEHPNSIAEKSKEARYG
ncbi:MAG: site-specific DNA-methyltransferase [Candidatus Poribacteria bacterium]|nr:site-specific DNA-methyltransferase [Candidatus Poribacteria bacterium]